MDELTTCNMKVSYDEDAVIYLELERDGEVLEIEMSTDDAYNLIQALIDTLMQAIAIKNDKPMSPLA